MLNYVHLATQYKKLQSSKIKEMVVLQTVIKCCLQNSELENRMLFSILIKEIIGEEAKENGLGGLQEQNGERGSLQRICYKEIFL